jgi:hypothetical protein
MASFLDQLLGTKPQVPKITPIDVSTEQQKAIANNLTALPQAEKLVSATNIFNRDQINQMMKAAGLDITSIGAQVGKTAGSLLAGEVPQDVSDAVQRSDAARALGGGYAGTDMQRDLTARDLGLVSLDLIGKGLSMEESWMNASEQLYGPGMMNLTSMFVSPQFQTAVDTEERNTQFQAQWLKNQIKAMPAPWAEDLKQFVYRAMSIYSGTSVQANPYSTPGSFGGGNTGGGMNFSNAMNGGDNAYGGYDAQSYMDSFNTDSGGGGGDAAAMATFM